MCPPPLLHFSTPIWNNLTNKDRIKHRPDVSNLPWTEIPLPLPAIYTNDTKEKCAFCTLRHFLYRWASAANRLLQIHFKYRPIRFLSYFLLYLNLTFCCWDSTLYVGIYFFKYICFNSAHNQTTSNNWPLSTAETGRCWPSSRDGFADWWRQRSPSSTPFRSCRHRSTRC